MNSKNIIYALIVCAGLCYGQRQYTVTPVPSPTGDNNYVVWVSDDGSTTFGSLQVGGTIGQCYSVKNGQFTAYPTPGVSCSVHSVNKSLQFAGNFGPATTAFLYTNGNFDPFGTRLPGGTTQSRGMNNHGDVVGVGVGGSGGVPLNYGFVYSGGKATILPANFYAAAINDNGDVSGEVTPSGDWDPNNCHAGIYRGGSLVDLGTVNPQDGPGYSQQINAAGQVSGYFLKAPFDTQHPSAPIPEPFFYDGTTMRGINIANAAYGGYGDFMNDSGEVVGRYYPDNLDACFNNASGVFTCNFTHRAFYYSNGTAVDLNTLLVNPPAGQVLRDVFYISNSGLILAGSPNAQGVGESTFLLTPVPSSGAGVSNGTITASPNPATQMVGGAMTMISWNAPSGVTAVEVHVGSATGPLFASGGATGSAATGPWVSNGLTFYLQDVSSGQTGVNFTTLGTVVVNVQ